MEIARHPRTSLRLLLCACSETPDLRQVWNFCSISCSYESSASCCLVNLFYSLAMAWNQIYNERTLEFMENVIRISGIGDPQGFLPDGETSPCSPTRPISAHKLGEVVFTHGPPPAI